MRTVVEVIPERTLPTQPLLSGSDQLLRLTHDARHIRRKVIGLDDGSRILVDLPEPTVLKHGDKLRLDDGAQIRIEAAEEDLLHVEAKDATHLTELAWHIGNRHLAAEIRTDGIRILRDHVIQDMLEKLGATVAHTRAPFIPVRGAYAGHSSHHHHHHGRHQDDGSGPD